jgi:alkylation response protein AidB-like acyl-CoA dehydrogenase
MDFSFTEDQRLLQAGLCEVLAGECSAEVVRQAWQSGLVPGLWRTLAETGLLGATADASEGGLGFSPLDCVLLFEEVGRAAVPEPVLETVAVAVPVLQAVGGTSLQADWLPRVVSGAAKLSVRVDDGLVVDGENADALVLFERDRVRFVERSDYRAVSEACVDGARRLARVEIDSDAGQVLAIHGEAAVVSENARRFATVAASAELIGSAEALLRTTVEYVKGREQFGRPIGSFQAVKHPLANALVELRFAQPMVYRAAWLLSQPNADPVVVDVAVSCAKAMASDAAMTVSRVALQAHGAMGYSFECDLHLWLKRVWTRASDWGDARHHRSVVADRVIGPMP